MSEQKFYDLVEELDRLLGEAQPAQEIERFCQLIRDTALYQYAFNHMKNPGWIQLLKERGFFSLPPTVIHDETKGTLNFPPWLESRYLMRMAPRTPEKVLEVVLQIPETDNPSVHGDLAEAALAMPSMLAATWVKKEIQWIQRQDHLYFDLTEKLGSLISHLAIGNEVDTALDLASSLLSIQPGQSSTKREEAPAQYLSPEPRARFDSWQYKQILQKHIPALVCVAGHQVLKLLCDILASAVKISLSHGEQEVTDDYSYIWRPAIEDNEQNPGFDSLKELLVSAVRDAAEQIAKLDPTQVPILVGKLEAHELRIFHRVALYLLFVFSETSRTLVAKRLTDHSLFDGHSLWHEYALLARKCFGQLSARNKAIILKWIERGPDIDRLKTDQEELSSQRLSDQESERYKKHWQIKKLAPIRDALSTEWKQRYDALVAEVGHPEHPDFVSVTTSWVGPTSPKTQQDLSTMSTDELRSYLVNWQPKKEDLDLHASPEGLGRQISELVLSASERYAQAASQFEGLDPTYIRSFLQGFRDALGQSKSFAWEPILSLCEWVVGQPQHLEGRSVDRWNADPDWGWTRRTIASLLGSAFQQGAVTLPYQYRQKAWKVLSVLTTDPHPTREEEERSGGPGMAAHMSINTTRGEAMHTVFRYALWVRKHLEKLPDANEEILALGFQSMQEVREVLDSHLDPELEPSVAIRSVYGQWFPWIVLIDPRWAADKVAKVFPSQEALRDFRSAAWNTYIIFCGPYDNVFDILREEYRHAVEEIGRTSRDKHQIADPEERLAEHLMTLYWRGKLHLDDSAGLLALFYSKASDSLCGHAFEFVGRSLHNTKDTVPSNILDRLQNLWAYRQSLIRTNATPTNHTNELAAFGWWFVSGKFGDAWAIPQLIQSLSITGKTAAEHLVIERLATLAEAMPHETVQCLDRMIEGDKDGWRASAWGNQTRTILAAAIRGGDPVARESAENLVHRLGARGFLDFRDLLPLGSQS
jgi:hypothetical protein